MPSQRPPGRATRPRYTRLPWQRAPRSTTSWSSCARTPTTTVATRSSTRSSSGSSPRARSSPSTTGASAGLTFEIDHQNEGEYFLYQFSGPASLLEELGRQLRIADGVLRFRIIKVLPGTPPPPEVRVEPVAAEY